ncbi:MAG: helix-turn-helix domain-containing protein, partial [Planctomycetaceae bacterium]
RAKKIRRLRERGHSYSEIVPGENRPLIVEMLTTSLYELADVSSRLRRAEAQALYSEGFTMAKIADLFGVTRQRVATLLRSGGGGTRIEVR